MKVSIGEIKKYVTIPDEISTDELIQRIGARLVEVEGVDNWAEKYRNIWIVKVVSCEAIPETHLHLCQIDVGREEPVQVVCGAPNVHAGMLAVWIAPGAIVPETFGGEDFAIGTRKMRGFASHGMLAAADELALGDDHEGIVEIDPKFAQAGDSFAEKFELNDLILDIENKSLTHRPDCFGLIGFAREVAGILGLSFREPELFANVPTAKQLQAQIDPAQIEQLQVEITDPALCPRYQAAVLAFAQAPRSKYLTPDDVFLAKAGMRSVSPIVDLTNILMLKTGQPLHAFDYDKLAALCGGSVEIRVRAARAGETMQLLDGKTVECRESDILICAGDTPVALAGAMGGASTAIDASTQKIVLESATFSLFNLRKTQMAHGIFSEAITRFTKGQPAWLTMPVLAAAVEQSGAKLLALAESYPEPTKPIKIQISTGEINGLLGTDYSHELIETTLENVGFAVEHCEPSVKTPATTFKITVPAWRTDVKIKEDLIEEVGRLLGYDSIELTFPQRDFVGAELDPLFSLKHATRQILAGDAGAHEVLTYSFVSEALLNQVGEDPAASYQIVNSISPELECFRQSLVPSLLTKIRPNLKAGYRDFVLFEMNQVARKGELQAEPSLGPDTVQTPLTHQHLAVVGLRDFYQLKAVLALLAKRWRVALEIAPADDKLPPYLARQRSATVRCNGQVIGYLGEISRSVRRRFKLEDAVLAAFELDLEAVTQAPQVQFNLRALAKFPSVYRDVTLSVPAALSFAEVKTKLAKALSKAQVKVNLQPTSIYQAAPDAATKNVSFHLELLGQTHTYTSAEVSAIMETVKSELDEQGVAIV